jgi:hypothetical protein
LGGYCRCQVIRRPSRALADFVSDADEGYNVNVALSKDEGKTWVNQ